MQKFEYKVIEVEAGLSQIQDEEKMLNLLGKNGWELITIKSSRIETRYYFKRERKAKI